MCPLPTLAPHSQAKQRQRATTSMQMRLLACCRVSSVAASGKLAEPWRAGRQGRRRRPMHSPLANPAKSRRRRTTQPPGNRRRPVAGELGYEFFSWALNLGMPWPPGPPIGSATGGRTTINTSAAAVVMPRDESRNRKIPYRPIPYIPIKYRNYRKK